MKVIGIDQKDHKGASQMKTGCHLVEIIELEKPLDRFGEWMHTKEGEPAVDFVYQNKDKQVISHRIWYSDKAEWVREKIYKALAIHVVNDGDSYSKSDFIGKKVHIVVSEVVRTYKGIAEQEPYEYRVHPNGYAIYSGVDPLFKGDPLRGQNPVGTMFQILEEQIKR